MAYSVPAAIVRSAVYTVLQPGQRILRESFPAASSTLNVKNSGLLHFGQEYCTAPVVIRAGERGALYGLHPRPNPCGNTFSRRPSSEPRR